MKKVLVTGASGSVGINVLKFLLSEGKYEITALDIKNKDTMRKLKKYNKRINIIYGDICDKVLMNALVKDHDVIIHLASVLPPFAEINKSICEIVEYNGTKNIINAINNYNEKCFLIYASTTSLYDSSLSGNINEPINKSEISTFSLWKYKTEELIKKEIDNYLILRVPLVLNNINGESFIFNIKKNKIIEVTTDVDAAYAFVSSIDYQKKLNKKIFNIGMGQEGRITYQELLNNILRYEGISIKYIFTRLFLDNNYRSPILSDSDKLDDIIHYRNDSLDKYYKRLKKHGKNKRIRKLLAKPIILLNKKKGD
jgi:nucleoside-diphosphate-sugar epimerase